MMVSSSRRFHHCLSSQTPSSSVSSPSRDELRAERLTGVEMKARRQSGCGGLAHHGYRGHIPILAQEAEEGPTGRAGIAAAASCSSQRIRASLKRRKRARVARWWRSCRCKRHGPKS
jgi:hypothetical protein